MTVLSRSVLTVRRLTDWSMLSVCLEPDKAEGIKSVIDVQLKWIGASKGQQPACSDYPPPALDEPPSWRPDAYQSPRSVPKTLEAGTYD